MTQRCISPNPRAGERGSTLAILAIFLFALLGVGALAVDLASLYVARNQAQRAADAAALAGAKYFVESGCVSTTSCAAFEATATARATLSTTQNLINGQPITVQSVTFNETSGNPQITVAVQSPNPSTLRLYFARAIGINSAPTIGATATAEAWNPSVGTASTTYCTGCLRPWLIPNCDQTILAGPSGSNALCNTATPNPEAYLLTPGSWGVEDPGCTNSGGVMGEPITIYLQNPTNPTLAPPTTLYGSLDVDNPGLGNLFDYQNAITTCALGQTTCGTYTYNILAIPPVPSALQTSTQAGVEALMHVASFGAPGSNQGQDYIDTTACPPQIHAGASNPLVLNGVVNQDDVVATSDSIVTAYIFDTTGLGYTGLAYSATSGVDTPQIVNVVGFAQIFVSQVDSNGTVYGNILSVAGCGGNPNATCGPSSGNGQSINSPTLLPVRLIQQTGN